MLLTNTYYSTLINSTMAIYYNYRKKRFFILFYLKLKYKNNIKEITYFITKRAISPSGLPHQLQNSSSYFNHDALTQQHAIYLQRSRRTPCYISY